MNKIIKIFKKNNGYSRMMELRNAGIQTRDIAQAVEKALLKKLDLVFTS